jgi:hypothetical protein
MNTLALESLVQIATYLSYEDLQSFKMINNTCHDVYILIKTKRFQFSKHRCDTRNINCLVDRSVTVLGGQPSLINGKFDMLIQRDGDHSYIDVIGGASHAFDRICNLYQMLDLYGSLLSKYRHIFTDRLPAYNSRLPKYHKYNKEVMRVNSGLHHDEHDTDTRFCCNFDIITTFCDGSWTTSLSSSCKLNHMFETTAVGNRYKDGFTETSNLASCLIDGKKLRLVLAKCNVYSKSLIHIVLVD